MIYIFKDNNLIYDSANRNQRGLYNEIVAESNISAYFNSINFSDQDADIYIDIYLEYKYYAITRFISGVILMILLNIIMFAIINKKIIYIETIENEIKILEGGDLNYKITIAGNDELTSLAKSINEMRKSFIERLKNEDDATNANKELITAMSHDLRTPLTVVLGYLDIIRYKKYKNEEDFDMYLNNCREKAYQIKSMSDKLFEYFLVFNNRSEIDFEVYNGNEILEQIIQEYIFLLSRKNYKFNLNHSNEVFFLEINLVYIRRVFDNIFTNISKYADNSKTIDIKYYIENKKVYLNIKNSINTNKKCDNSTGIGLKTCKRIIEMHKGEFNVSITNNIFNVSIELNIN